MRSIFTFSLFLASVFLFFLFIRGLLRKEHIKFVSLNLFCFIVCTGVLSALLYLGSGLNFELYGIKFNYKTPSELDKVTGNSEAILTATSSVSGSGNVRIQASSSEPIDDSAFHFLTGEKFIVDKQQSQDGKEHIFDISLPPGQKIQIAAPPQVIMFPLTNQILNRQLPPQTTNTPSQ